MSLEKEFAGKIIVVTGASRGIGKQVALEFSRQGAEGIVMVSTGKGSQIQEVAHEVEENGSRALVLAVDLSTPDSAKQVMTPTKKEFGRLNVLVNVAGIARDRDLFRMSIPDWDAVMNVNLRPAYFLTQAGFPLFPKGQGGSVTNISSIIGIEGNSGQENYAASKAGVIGLTKSLCHNLGRRGIRVNAVAPGFIETDMTQNLGAQYKEETSAAYARLTPLGRIGTVEDIASAVVFLANDRLAGFITGQTLIVDGGIGASLHAIPEMVKMSVYTDKLKAQKP